MARTKLRFKVASHKPNGVQRKQHSTDELAVAWDWFVWFNQAYPLDEVTILDREQDIEATG